MAKNFKQKLSIEQRYDNFCKDAEELLERAGLARPDQTPLLVGKSFLNACNALASLHFPEDKEVGGIGPRGLIWGMYSSVVASNIHHKDPDPIAGAFSIAEVIRNIIKYRPPLDFVNKPEWAEKPVEKKLALDTNIEQDESLCFVIMSFSQNPQFKKYYSEAIKPTVEKYGYRCERTDEQEFNDSIKNRILLNISKAKFIIADVTDARPNCYYELGIAHALKKEVIHLANSINDIHFDVNDFNFIIYSSIEELVSKINKRLTATLGHAKKKSLKKE